MFTISEALRLGREASRGGREHIQNLEYLGELVTKFATTHWQIQTFDELKIHHVLQLVRDMENQGRSASYIKHAINAIRLASNYMSDYHGLPSIKIEQRHLPEVLDAPKIWLTYRQLAKCCHVAMDTDIRKRVDTAKSNPRPLALARVMVMACGLCGLRLTEFGRLTPDCLDSAGNLTITEDAATGKRVKNNSSNRIIPLPGFVAAAMRDYWDQHGQWSSDRTNNAKRIRALFHATADVTGDSLYLITPPKNLRKTLPNQLDDAVDDKYIMAYGGWAFKGTMHRKYQALRPHPNDPEPIRERALDRLRETVVAAIEKKCTGLHF